jgi:hypothetical protein
VAAAIPNAEAREDFHTGKASVAQQHNWNMTQPALFTEMVRAWIAGAPLPEAIKPLVVSPRL